MMEDANYMSDVVTRPSKKPFDGRNTHLSWGTQWGMTSVVDLDGASITHNAKGKSADEYTFDGFTSFALSNDAKTYLGLSPHVTEDGFCSNGCFRFGHQDVASGLFTGLNSAAGLPFKSVMSNTRFYHEQEQVYYAQGSYPLTPEAHCDPDETKQCLFAVNASTGELLSSKPMETFVAYKYEDALHGVAADGTVMAWGFGFQETCGKDLNSFAFARVHLATATPKLVACIPKEPTVHYNPSMGGFSHDNARFATGSGNPETGSMQLLVYNTSSGENILNTNLTGLTAALPVSSDAPFAAVWGIAHMPPSRRG